jgi:hypothetical protein
MVVAMMNELAIAFIVVLTLVMSWFCMLFLGAFDDMIERRKRILEARQWDRPNED